MKAALKSVCLGLEAAQDKAALCWGVSAGLEDGNYCLFLTGGILQFVSVLTTRKCPTTIRELTGTLRGDLGCCPAHRKVYLCLSFLTAPP